MDGEESPRDWGNLQITAEGDWVDFVFSFKKMHQEGAADNLGRKLRLGLLANG